MSRLVGIVEIKVSQQSIPVLLVSVTLAYLTISVMQVTALQAVHSHCFLMV